jgi:hypothetical protein
MSVPKWVGLLSAIVFIVMTMTDVGSAGATRICREEGVSKTCLGEAAYLAGTNVEMTQNGKGFFAFGFSDECNSSTWKGVTENAGGTGELATVLGLFKEADWNECTCKTTGELPLEFEVLGDGNRSGDLDFVVEVEFNCGGVKCSYRGELLKPLEGGNQANLSVAAVLNKTWGGFLCKTTAVWEAKYVFAEPIPMFITED